MVNAIGNGVDQIVAEDLADGAIALDFVKARCRAIGLVVAVEGCVTAGTIGSNPAVDFA